MNKVYPAVVLIVGLVLNGVVMASWFYDRFVPKDSFVLIIQRLDRIEDRLDVLVDSINHRR